MSTSGELPIFSCKAHVFTIDPKTKKTWLPASTTAISVSFFYDKVRELYRVFSVDEHSSDSNKKVAINSIMSEKMSFKKTSQKFGQWADSASGTVYGLGFTHESELDKFVEQFCKALDHIRQMRRTSHADFPAPPPSAESSHGYHNTQSHVDLDHNGTNGDQFRQENERLTYQMNQLSVTLSSREQEIAMLKSRMPTTDSDSRAQQLEKENSFLRQRVKQLEDENGSLTSRIQDISSLSQDFLRQLQGLQDCQARLARASSIPNKF